MSELRKKIFEVLKEFKDGLTRPQLIAELERRLGKKYARTTVFDNIPQEIVKKVHVYQARGRPYVKFKLIKDYENYINEEFQ